MVDMDIHQLIDTVAQLNTKLSDLNKIEIAKKQVIEDVNRDIVKSRQLLEDKAKGLEKNIENKLNGLKKLDDELLKSRALLAKLNKSQNLNSSGYINNDLPSEEQKTNIQSDNNQDTNLQPGQSRSNLMNTSLEDFIAQKFQEEYKVKYPENNNFRLTNKDFETVLSALKGKAKQSDDLQRIIDEYLSSYSQTLTDSQIKMLEQEKNKSLAK
ncbi:MAG: hypothetical protein HC939_23200 [Pleurocapsa sp. SU_5_0]|nr:hypothetical protein [Pleurocapsa sp. SU_5_0]NJO98168.1 hypothetical protein [Pleurocapsa sp. CRU_1_2]NJR44926.1 hypothetical protein [Hyellaceae cyanobacterium CSU_1_1]